MTAAPTFANVARILITQLAIPPRSSYGRHRRASSTGFTMPQRLTLADICMVLAQVLCGTPCSRLARHDRGAMPAA